MKKLECVRWPEGDIGALLILAHFLLTPLSGIEASTSRIKAIQQWTGTWTWLQDSLPKFGQADFWRPVLPFPGFIAHEIRAAQNLLLAPRGAFHDFGRARAALERAA